MNGRITLPKVKGGVPIRYHRKLPGEFKTATISYHHGIWEVSIPVKVTTIPAKKTLKSIGGFDVNSSHTLVSSSGWYVSNPRSLKNNEVKLKQIQRKLSRQNQGSTRWKKTKQRLQQIHFKIRQQRLDFGHQVSSSIAKNFDLVVFEDLNVKAMQQWNGRMTGDNIMSEISSLTAYKVAREGGLFHKINRFAPSTKICSSCNHKQDMGLNDRVFDCGGCGLFLCRDWNSGINIANTGIKELELAGTVSRVLPPKVQQKLAVKAKASLQIELAMGSVSREAA